MITQKAIYNASKKKNNWKIKRSIELQKVEAMTISQPTLNSNELIIHVKNEYDYRYVAPSYKNSLVNIIRKACNRQVQLGFRTEQCKIYQVNKSNLKMYSTLKSE